MSNNNQPHNPFSLANRITALEVKVEQLEKSQGTMHTENIDKLNRIYDRIDSNRAGQDEKYAKIQRTIGIGIGIIITVNAAIAIALAIFRK